VKPVLRVLAFVFPLQGMATVAESLMKRELQFRVLANVDLISYSVGYGAVGVAYGLVGITLALFGQGVWALVLGQIAQNVVRTAVLLSRYPPRISMPDRRAFRDLMAFGGGFTVAKIANQLAQEGDYLVVGRFLGPGPLGLYGRAYHLMSAPASGFATILDAVLFPAMARVQSEAHRLAAAYRRGVALIALVILPASATFVLLAPEIVRVALGPRWANAIAPFQILAAGMLFRTSSKIADSLTRATGAVYRRAWRQALYAALVMGAAWVGAHWGIAGVAWGVLLALTLNFLLMAQLSMRETGMTWLILWQAHVPALLITSVLSPIVWTVVTMCRGWAIGPLPVLAAGVGVMLAGALLLVILAPRAFLGSDGEWMVETMRGFVHKLMRSQPASTPAAG
jgi:O-antigen/teichoic acid export membrane protein